MKALRAQLILLTWIAGTACGTDSTDEPRPNLILILADTLRSDHLGSGGYGRSTSPNLDALASEGAEFERCFSTYPQTAASVASIFTSLYPSGHKVSEQKLLLSEVPLLMAESLQAAGYQTAAVATNPHLTPGLGFERGFASYVYIHGRNQKRSSYAAPPTASPGQIEFRQSKGSYYGRADDVNLAALEWLDGRNLDAPFFLYLHYMDVHSPYISPEPFHGQFVEGEGRNVYQNGLAKGKPSAANRAFTQARYDGGVAFLDHSIGQLRAGLDSRDLSESTYLIFTSDHGDEFMEHGGFGHGETLHRELTQVPLLICGPDLPASRWQTQVSLVDIFPTVCELLALPLPAGLQGLSLAASLRDPQLPLEATSRSYSEGDPTRSPAGGSHARIALYDGRWHLIHRPDNGKSELYEYLLDPSEQHDLAQEQAETVKRLTQRALMLQEQARLLGTHIVAREATLGEGAQAALGELGYGGDDEEEEDGDEAEQD